MKGQLSYRLALRFLLLVILALSLIPTVPIYAAKQVNASEAPAYSGNCRFGITALGNLNRYDYESLGVGAFLDWRQTPDRSAPRDLEYVHVIRLRDGSRQFVYDPKLSLIRQRFEAALTDAVQSHPGGAWLIGNEPDTTFDGQDGLTPAEYATAYHSVYRLIKSQDPKAKIGIGTIVQPTPLRLKWLEAMWKTYQDQYHMPPPSDFWSIHSFILREKLNDWGTGIPPGIAATAGELYTLEQTNDVEIFEQRLIEFRAWLAEHGERTKPLWVTEYGSLLPHDGRRGYVTQPVESARDYMLATFDFLLTAVDPEIGNPNDDNRLVQRWFWYSLDDNLWRFGGSLFDPLTGKRTLIGDAFADYVADVPLKPSLKLLRPPEPVLAIWPRVPDGNVLVRVAIGNSGTTPATAVRRVTWYLGDPTQGGRRLAGPFTVHSPLAGCGATEIVSAYLRVPSESYSELFVKLESADLAHSLQASVSALSDQLAP